MIDPNDNPYYSGDASRSSSKPDGRRSVDPSVFSEPHLVRDHFVADENDTAEQPIPDEASRQIEDDQIEHGIWDEPALSVKLAGPIPADALTYDQWLSKNVARTTREATWRNTFLLSLAAGPWAVAGAFAAQLAHGSGSQVILACVVAPVSEEIMKVAASLWVVEKRPFLFSSKLQILVVSAISGLTFAAIENVMYLHVGLSAPTYELAELRWTVCTALHVACSLIAGLGLTKIWSHTMVTQSRPEVSRATPYFLMAMTVHGIYNFGAMTYALAGG